MATYSRTNGWIGLGVAGTCAVVAIFDSLEGSHLMAGAFGLASLALLLQALDDLLWEGRHPETAKVRWVLAGLAATLLVAHLVLVVSRR